MGKFPALWNKQGIPASESDLTRIFHRHADLYHYSHRELAHGITEHYIENYPYLVTPESLFYSYLRAEGKRDVYLFRQEH